MTSNDIKDYRCMFKNNTRDLTQKFNFVIKVDFVKLVKNNSNEIFEIIKHLLTTYYIMNKTSRSLQKKLTLTIIDNNQLKKRVEVQKQKISNFSKKH